MARKSPELLAALALVPPSEVPNARKPKSSIIYVWNFQNPLEQGGFERLAEIFIPVESDSNDIALALEVEGFQLKKEWNGVSGEVVRL